MIKYIYYQTVWLLLAAATEGEESPISGHDVGDHNNH